MNAAIATLVSMESLLRNNLGNKLVVDEKGRATSLKEIQEYESAIRLLEAVEGLDRGRALRVFDAMADFFGFPDLPGDEKLIAGIRALLDALPEK